LGDVSGAINRGGAVRTRRAQQQTDSLKTPAPGPTLNRSSRDTRPLSERFTLEAKVSAVGDRPTGVARGSQWTNRQRTTGAASFLSSVGDDERHGEPVRTL